MKRKNDKFEIKFPPITLFLEDIEEIIEIFKEYSEKFEIEIDDYELNSFDEINKINKLKTHNLYLYSFKPAIHLTLTSQNAYVQCDGNNHDAIGIATKINKILQIRAQKYKKYIIPILYLKGIWKDRTDIGDSVLYTNQLRSNIEKRKI